MTSLEHLEHADKRWRDRDQRWVRPGPLFRPQLHAVDVIESDRTAKTFVCQHHYAGSFPAARLKVGLFGPNAQLLGVAVFSQPTNNGTVPLYTGLPREAGCELGRFILLDEVPFNAETWFLARAFRFLREEKGISTVVSYADPLPRTNESGEITKLAHWGQVYQASNATYVGRARKRNLVLAPDGTVVSERALSKLRAQDQGWQYAYRQLLAHGCPPRAPYEDLDAYVDRAIAGLRRIKHPGNLTYVFSLDRTARKAIDARHGAGLPYLKAA